MRKSLIFGSDAVCITVNFDENKIYVTWIIISILDASKKRSKSRRRFKNALAFLLGFYSVYSVFSVVYTLFVIKGLQNLHFFYFVSPEMLFSVEQQEDFEEQESA